MRKFITICIIFILILIVGCETQPTNSDDLSVFNDTPISYQMYCDTPQNAIPSESAISADKQIVFENASQLDLSYSSINDTVIGNASATKQFTLENDSFQLKLKKSYATSFANSQRSDLHSYGYYDLYQTENETDDFEIAFRQNSNQLAYLRSLARLNQSGNVTEQEARVYADSALTELYGEQVLQEYTNVVVQTTAHSTYAFTYSRLLSGYLTNDRIAIEINFKGKVCYINARQLGIFDSLEAEITEQKISTAESILRDSISETYQIQGKQLFVDAISGKCYLQLIVARTTDTGYEGNYFYINVN